VPKASKPSKRSKKDSSKEDSEEDSEESQAESGKGRNDKEDEDNVELVILSKTKGKKVTGSMLDSAKHNASRQIQREGCLTIDIDNSRYTVITSKLQKACIHCSKQYTAYLDLVY
jgi:hypothetical protein